MLPRPLAAIPGANAATRKNGALTLLANILSNASAAISAVGPKSAMPALLIRMKVGEIAEVGGGEARLAAGGGDLRDCFGAPFRVAAVNNDFGSVAGQLQRHRATDA